MVNILPNQPSWRRLELLRRLWTALGPGDGLFVSAYLADAFPLRHAEVYKHVAEIAGDYTRGRIDEHSATYSNFQTRFMTHWFRVSELTDLIARAGFSVVNAHEFPDEKPLGVGIYAEKIVGTT